MMTYFLRLPRTDKAYIVACHSKAGYLALLKALDPSLYCWNSDDPPNHESTHRYWEPSRPSLYVCFDVRRDGKRRMSYGHNREADRWGFFERDVIRATVDDLLKGVDLSEEIFAL